MGFFKAYDMRGTYGVDFGLDTVRRVGLTLPGVVGARRWLTGRDCRETSDAVAQSLAEGLCAAGADVCDLGPCTTPMVYFFTAVDGYDGSVMVTASHNPPGDNGLKVSKKTALPVGYADGLDEVERLVAAPEPAPAAEPGALRRLDRDGALERYVAWQKEHSRGSDLSGLKYAVDCSNGMASILASRLFPDALIINDVPDGRFPAHSPNPLRADAREQMAALVREKGLDCGVIFDGDADRAMFVDENGDFVQPDYLIPLVAAACLAEPACAAASSAGRPVVLHDVRTSRGAIEVLKEMGCEPSMVRVGHAFAKPAMRERAALCGGELAGHYYFSDFFGCDSGVLAALRVLGEVARGKAQGVSFSGLVAPISSRYANSGEINFKVDDKDAAARRILAAAARFGEPVGQSDIDGVRLEFADGWINVRKSNTEPYLRLVAERRGDVSAWVAELTAAAEGR